MHRLLFWLYFGNVVFLLIHEIDSAYWKEWNLFFRGPTGKGLSERAGLTLFLIAHFPLVALGLFGLVDLARGGRSGLVIALMIALAGLFAFVFHGYHLRAGRPEFKTPISQFVLLGTAVLSLGQLIVTLLVLVG